MKRRTLLLAPAVLLAQPARPKLAIQWISGKIPEAFAREAVVFARAYAACPDRNRAAWALEHGRYPHAGGGDHSLWDYFTRTEPDAADVIVMTSHSADGKDSWRERSLCVPLAIRWRGKLAPRVVNGLCSHVDILPTLLRVAGGAASPELQGRDALGASAEAIYAEGGIESREEWRALLRGYDKVVWTFMKDGEEVTGMYNIADDPEEVHDLKAASEHRLTRDSLWALAERWMERLEDGRDSFGLRLRR